MNNAPFQLPYARHPRFVGRDEELAQMHALSAQWLALTGIAGVGKTQLAVEYAHRHRDAYPGGVYWVTAPGAGWQAGLARAALTLGLSAEGAHESEREMSLAQAFGAHLTAHPGALVVLDDVENPETLWSELLASLPRSLECRVLLTTRGEDGGPWFVALPLAPRGAADLQGRWDALSNTDARRVLQTAAVLDVGAEISKSTLALLTGLTGTALDAALDALHRLSLIDARTDGATRLDSLVRAFALRTLDADASFASRCAEALCDALCWVDRLEFEVAQRGVDAVCADLRIGASLASEDVRERIARLAQPLGREVRRLRSRRSAEAPGFFLQQLRNSCFELGDEALQARVEEELDARHLPHLRARHRTSRDSAALVWTLGEDTRPQDIAITPDGRFAITSTQDGALKVWDIERGQLVRVLEGHVPGVAEIALAPDGRSAISASLGGTLEVWDISSGRVLRTIETGTRGLFAVAVTPDGRHAITASFGALHVWELASGQAIRTLTGHQGTVQAVAVTPDGRSVVSGANDGTIKLWEIATGRVVHTFEGHEGYVGKVAVTPDARFVVSASWDGTVRMWDLATGGFLCFLERQTDDRPGMALTSDGRFVLSGSARALLNVWEHSSGRIARTLGSYPLCVTDLAVTPDGRFALATGYFGSIMVWDMKREQRAAPAEGHTQWERQRGVRAVAVTADGRFAVAASEDHRLTLWDLTSGASVRVFEGHDQVVTCAALTSDGRSVVSVANDHTLKVWSLETGLVTLTLEFEDPPSFFSGESCLALTPDGRYAISAWEGKRLDVWDLSNGRSVRTLEGHTDLVGAVAVTPDGRFAVSGARDNTLRVWDLANGRCVRTHVGHTGAVQSVAVTPDGRFVVSASADATLRVWEFESGRSVHALQVYRGAPRSVAITPDGRCAIAAMGDGLQVWDLGSGKALATLETHGDPRCCAVASDGTTVVVGGSDHGLYVFDCRLPKTA